MTLDEAIKVLDFGANWGFDDSLRELEAVETVKTEVEIMRQKLADSQPFPNVWSDLDD